LRAGKRIHPKEYSRVYRTIRHSFRNVSAAEDLRKVSSELSSSSEEEVSPGPRIPTVFRIITGKLFYRIVPLQLPAALSPSASEGRTYSMSWDDRVSAKKKGPCL